MSAVTAESRRPGRVTRRWSGPEKVVFGVAMMVLAPILPPLPASALIIFIMTVALFSHPTSPDRRMALVLNDYWRVVAPSVIFSLLSVFVVAVSFTTGPAVELRDADLLRAGHLLIRALAGISCLGYLILATTVTDLARVLRTLGLPAPMVGLMLTTARFAFVLAGTARTMRLAQAARAGYDTRSAARRSLAMLAATLFVMAMDRGRRLEAGLAARAGEGETLTAVGQTDLSLLRLTAIACLVAAVILLSLLPLLLHTGGRP